MKQISLILVLATMVLFTGCNMCKEKTETDAPVSGYITENQIIKTCDSLKVRIPQSEYDRVERGIRQVAALWIKTDGSPDDFTNFCINSFVPDSINRLQLFNRISDNLEALNGNFNRITIALMKPLHLDQGDYLPIDMLFGGYNVGAHLTDDFFANKIAFYTILNFPAYTLEEKSAMGEKWSRQEWAFVRLGDVFTTRIPAETIQKISDATTNADTYISDYNIYMANLIDDNGKTWFPEGLKLITHWGLRDELKSNYNSQDGLKKQKLIYAVMKNIITQEIPENVINNPEHMWNPVSNKLFDKENKEIKFKPEPNTRYEHLLNIFHAMKAVDPYSPQYPTYIQRKFDGEMELTQPEVEKLFIDLLTSPEVKDVAALISKRLGRPLEPFDIWYDGFKSRSTINEAELTAITSKKYPTPAAFQNELPVILTKLGWSPEKAKYISDKVTVDPSRGAGHAWGSEMRGDNARLRTRIGANGMDYKGYNIATHEFGHNVEQTLSLYDVDFYTMKGVPNTAFTEALAFIFQKRDLELLGISNPDENKDLMMALDNFWACYEIMGVSLVDMKVWQWLYENPDANAQQLKESVLKIAREVWNSYYAPVFGTTDEPILAVYSHMIDSPLYLSAYPVGHLIDFQIEEYIRDKNFAESVEKLYTQGRLIPQIWMKQGVGNVISIDPLIKATRKALETIKE